MAKFDSSANWSLIPDHMQEGVLAYLEQGRPPGAFLQAVLENDLRESVGRADDVNRTRIHDYVIFFYNYAPCGSWGSPDACASWIRRGGLMGKASPFYREPEEESL